TKHPVDQEQIGRLLSGVLLNDEPEPIAAAACEKAGANLLRLTLTSGKYHQVKRMVAAAGNRVEALHREAVGELSLPTSLQPGEWRWLVAVDLEKLGYSR
ncbi:MAG: 16S rRNA pseudouridine(516) synthase, partial [Candidatus Dechloromonas phosphoritropha]